jgi:hypothetical protein
MNYDRGKVDEMVLAERLAHTPPVNDRIGIDPADDRRPAHVGMGGGPGVS